jgi:hypothetical protein
MAGTFTIPLTTVTVGSHDFGPALAADGDSLILLNIDRTVVNHGVQGLNGQPATTTVSLATFQSGDGGVTWQGLAENVVTGGIFTKGGTQINTDQIGTELNPGTGRQVRATVVVAGASVAVAGSLTTS